MKRKTVNRNALISLTILVPMCAIIIFGNSSGNNLPDSGALYYLMNAAFLVSALLLIFGTLVPVSITHLRKTTPDETWYKSNYAGARFLASLFLINDTQEN